MMVRSRQASASRSFTLRRLTVSTALAGTLAVLPGTAWAQNSPVNPDVKAGGATFNGATDGSATNLGVRLNAQGTIIEWDSFNIGRNNTVDFRSSVGEVAVLNRVVGGDLTTINGKLTSGSDVSVFLVNTRGIFIGSNGSVSTGSFVASTLPIDNNDFKPADGTYRFAAPALSNRSTAVTVAGSITTTGTGIGLILLGHQLVSNSGQLNSGNQETALVAADDVTLNYTSGSPLGIKIDRGTSVGNGMQVLGGTIRGQNVYFAMATRGSLTNSLLQIDGNITALAGAKGIVIVGGRAAVDPDVTVRSGALNDTGRAVEVRTTGTLTSGGSVRIGASDAVSVGGAVTSGGDYSVAGTNVTLGAANTPLRQEAKGAVSIIARDGDIRGLGALSLAADVDGSGSQALRLDGKDDIDFAQASSLESGGASLASAINIFSGDRNANVLLGNVRGLTIDGGLSGGALEGGLVRAASGGGNGGQVRAGTVQLGAGATISASTLTLSDLSAAGNVSLTADAMRVGSVTSSTGAVTLAADSLRGLTTNARTSVSGSGAVAITVAGNAALDTVTSTAGAVTLDAGSFDANAISADTGATLTTRTGNARLGGLAVRAGSATLTADDDALIAGTVSVGGDYGVLADNVQLSGKQAASGATTIEARNGGTISNAGALQLYANSDATGTEALTLRGRVALGANSALYGGTGLQSNVVIDSGTGNTVTLGDVEAAALTIAGGAPLTRDLTVGKVTTTSDLALLSTAAVRTGALRSTTGAVTLQGATIAVDGAINAATAATLTGGQVDFTTVNAGSATLTTSSPGSTRLRGTAVTTNGALTLASNGGFIDIGAVSAGTDLSVSSVGAVTLGSATAGGSATLQTTGAASDIVIGTALTAAGAVSLNTSRNLSAAALTSTGGAVSVTAAGSVGGPGGSRTTLSASGDINVTAGGAARLAAVNGGTVTLQAGSIDSGVLTGSSGVTATATTGDAVIAGLTTSTGNAAVVAAGTATIDGPVGIGGNYSVSGNSVLLGGTQNAAGAVDVTATSGTIRSGTALRLTANSDGLGTEALTLHGSAALGADSLLRGGSDFQSQVVIDAPATQNVTLGDVEASNLAIAGGATLGGLLTVGDVVTRDAISLALNGGIVASGLTSRNGAITLSGAGGATIGLLSASALDVGMGGAVAITRFDTPGAARFASSGGNVALGAGSTGADLTVDAAGLAEIRDAITAGGAYRVRGGSVLLGNDADAELQQAAGVIDITATAGDITGGAGLTLRSGAALILDASGAIGFGDGALEAGPNGTGSLGLRAGAGQLIDLGGTVLAGAIGSVDATHGAVAPSLIHDGNLRVGTLTLSGPLDIRLANADFTVGVLTTPGAVALNTGSGTIDIGVLDAGAITATAGAIRGASYRASGDITLDGGTITLGQLASTAGSVRGTASGGTLSVDAASAAIDLLLRTTGTGNVSVGTASAGGNLTLDADAGDVLVDRATAGGTLTLEASGNIGSRSGAGAELSANDVILTLGGTLVTNSVSAPGALTVNAAAMRLGSASAGRALSLNARSGDLSVRTATAGGAVTLTAAGALDAGQVTSGGDATLSAGTTLGIAGLSAPGAATITAGGAATLGTLAVGSLTLDAASLDAGDTRVTGAATIRTGGALRMTRLATGGAATLTGATIVLDALESDGAASLGATSDVTLGSWRTPAGLTVSGSGALRLGDGRGGTLGLTGGSVQLGDAQLSGAANITATGSVSATRLAAGPAVVSGSDVTIGTLEAGDAALTGSNAVQLGTARVGALRIGGGAVRVEDAAVTGAATLNGTGAVDVRKLSAAEVRIGAGSTLALGELTTAGGATLGATGNATLGLIRAGTLAVTAAGITAADVTTTGNTALTSSAGLTVTQLAAADADLKAGSDLTVQAARARILTLTAPGATQLGSVQASALRATGGSLRVDDGTITGATTADMTGAIQIGRLSTAEAQLKAGTTLAATDLTATNTATLTAIGAATFGTVKAATLNITAAGITATGLTSSGSMALNSSAGVTVDQIAAADADLKAGGDLAVRSLRARALTTAAAGATRLGAVEATTLKASGGALRIDDATITGSATADMTGAIELGRLSAADAQFKTGGTLAASNLSATNGVTLNAGGNATLGTVKGARVDVTANGISAADVTATGTLSLASGGALSVERASAAEAKLDAVGLATLGTVAGSTSVTVRAGDMALNGTVRAPVVTLGNRDPQGRLRLGSAGDAAGDGVGLSEAEVGRIDADRAVFDGSRGTVEIGTLSFGANSGRTGVDILTSGDVQVTGVVSGSGSARLFRFGGSASAATDMARSIQILATADAGGRLLFDGSDLELRGARIALGQNGFLVPLFANGGLTAEQAAALYVANSNSPLYSALAGGSPYLPNSTTTLTASRLTVRFNDFALFQNTGTRGFNTGVVLSGSPGTTALNIIGPGEGARNAFALFGTINGISGTSSAVLGSTIVSAVGIDAANARINGCVVGSGSGCLTTTISQPTLNVFDPGRLVVFRAEQDFTIPFDPLIGSNNEALFAGLGAISEPTDCPQAGTTGCVPAQKEPQ